MKMFNTLKETSADENAISEDEDISKGAACAQTVHACKAVRKGNSEIDASCRPA